ncbi:MAG: diguanylate cyclase [Magnetococcales bacterium]|nr:diguanylate cyclase [Magnetococcales bacterium]
METNLLDTAWAQGPEKAIEIAERVWWVGHYLEGDPFQCHCYLLENGDESVLFDPGSQLTFEHTLEKIQQVTDFSNIRYFVCHHQDPDITGIMPHVDTMITREDAVLVSHWRTNVLLKHYGLKLPLVCVEKEGWTLELKGGRTLKFVFTPYLHFPGAFCTFDGQTGTLFSSDLFGGFTEGWSLVAKDESYFEALRPFHEHYMPTREILLHGLLKLEEFPVTMIAPQHGSIIPEHLVHFMIDRLKSIDCGLFLLTKTNSDVHRLSSINKMLRNVMDAMILHRDFSIVAKTLLKLVQPLLPVQSLEFFTKLDGGDVLHLSPIHRYSGSIEHPPSEVSTFLGLGRDHWTSEHQGPYLLIDIPKLLPNSDNVDPPSASEPHDENDDNSREPGLVLPLFSPGRPHVTAVTIFHLKEKISIDEEMERVLSQLSVPLGVAVEREAIYRSMDIERQKFYEQSIRDSLTGLYTRFYMNEAIRRLFDIHDRDPNAAIAVAAFDIDYFKSVNDTYGHHIGDLVLKQVGQVLLNDTRNSDVPVRLGGEEFAVFIVGKAAQEAGEIANRIRVTVSKLLFEEEMPGRQITISCGLAYRQQLEPLDDVLQRADAALYDAKNGGRNRVVLAS